MIHFQQMLKVDHSEREIQAEAGEALKRILAQTPIIQNLDIEIEPTGQTVDLVAHFEVGGRPYALLAEVEGSGQPRHVRAAIHKLSFARDRINPGTRPAAIVIAPYLSEGSRALCQELDVGYLDLEGNCRIALDSVFIERTVPTKPAVARRDLKSIFKPKSAQVLRVLLKNPERSWKVVDLADQAQVSVGHVSNVRSALVDREWASTGPEGLRLTAPIALLDAWRTQYEPPSGRRHAFYTTLHGSSFDHAVRDGLGAQGFARAVLASFSAAQWMAPFARSASHLLYADRNGLDRLVSQLKLTTTNLGENVVITVLDDDDGLFLDTVEPSPGVFTTSPVQTYLDMTTGGERGREAAEHLRREALPWSR
jgi:hypothetical protein